MHLALDSTTHAAGQQAARNCAWCSPAMVPGANFVPTFTGTKKIRPVRATGGPARGGSL